MSDEGSACVIGLIIGAVVMTVGMSCNSYSAYSVDTINRAGVLGIKVVGHGSWTEYFNEQPQLMQEISMVDLKKLIHAKEEALKKTP